MEYLQYVRIMENKKDGILVLNLIINGIPSIPKGLTKPGLYPVCFKPYYKWNTFNTQQLNLKMD